VTRDASCCKIGRRSREDKREKRECERKYRHRHPSGKRRKRDERTGKKSGKKRRGERKRKYERKRLGERRINRKGTERFLQFFFILYNSSTGSLWVFGEVSNSIFVADGCDVDGVQHTVNMATTSTRVTAMCQIRLLTYLLT